MNDQLREANEYYRKAKRSSGVSRVLRRSYLEKAVRIYHEQLNHLRTEQIVAKAALWRNIAMSNLQLALVLDEPKPRAELERVVFHLKEAIASLITALTLRPNDVNTEWGTTLQASILECFDTAFQRSRELVDDGDVNMMLKSVIIDHMFSGFPKDDPKFAKIQLKARLAKAEFLFRSAVILLQEMDFRRANQVLEYAREEVEVAFSFSSRFRLNSNDVNVVQQDVYLLQCCCNSVRCRFQGDQMFEEQIHEAETINFDTMWEIVDIYKESLLQTREVDLENEAIALSRLGRVFHKVFKDRGKAHNYYRRAFDLVQALHPRDFSKVDWFVETKNALHEFQQSILREEEKREEAMKKPILKKLEPELKEMKAVYEKKDSGQFLKFVYSKHPPKVTYEFKAAEMKSTNMKSYIMKAITHYHPDRQAQFGIEWQVLCNEITKYLNGYYSQFKSI